MSAPHHGLVRHPITPRELLVGAGNGGSAHCVCGRWQISMLANHAAVRATNAKFLIHLAQEGVIRHES